MKIYVNKDSEIYKNSLGAARILLSLWNERTFYPELKIEGDIGAVVIIKDLSNSNPLDFSPSLASPEYELKCFMDEVSHEQAVDGYVGSNVPLTGYAVLCDVYRIGEKISTDTVRVLLGVDAVNKNKILWGRIFVMANYKSDYKEVQANEFESRGLTVEQVKKSIWDWVDKPLAAPYKFHYMTVQKDRSEKPAEGMFCIQRVKTDLLIDLNVPVSANANCTAK